MQVCRIRLMIGIMSVMSFLPVAMAEPNSRPQIWMSDFEKAQSESQRLDRPLLIHFYADWCLPCAQMQREVLHSDELAGRLINRFVAVKVNSDQNREIVDRFGIESLPYDIIVDPSGRVIAEIKGYRTKGEYLARVARTDALWSHWQKVQLARRQKAIPNRLNADRIGHKPVDNESIGKKVPVGKLQPPTPTRQRNDEGTVDRRDRLEENSPLPEKKTVGLDGYSPVALWNNRRRWTKGKPEFSSSYKGIVYQMADADELDEFESNFARYAPRLLGCDPVILWKTDRAVRGSTAFAAYYNDELFLFTHAKNRTRFKTNPSRYSRARYVFRADEIEELILR